MKRHSKVLSAAASRAASRSAPAAASAAASSSKLAGAAPPPAPAGGSQLTQLPGKPAARHLPPFAHPNLQPLHPYAAGS
eukprot:6178518-Pleurochrysis_carterae.AAC.1